MKKTVITIMTIVLVIAAVVGAAYYVSYDYRNDICNIDILGFETEGMSYDDLDGFLQSEMVYGIGDLSLEEALSYDFSNIVLGLKSVSFKEYMTRDYDMINFKPTYRLDGDMLQAVLEEYNLSKSPTRDASYEITSDGFVLTEEVYGDQLNIDIFADYIEDYLFDNTYLSSNISLSDFYVLPAVTAADFADIKNTVDMYANWSVTYNNGNSYAINPAESLSIVEGVVIVDETFLDTISRSVYNDYNTIGEPKSFTTTGGETIEIGGGTWGYEVWRKKELSAITEAFYDGETLTDREPVYVNNFDEIGRTYVEVSIAEQKCWVYRKGKLYLETDIVTGTKNRNDTPTGIYYIVELVDGKYLVGDDYKTWVDKWMRVTWSGIGLHDAGWRSTFGGKIYTYNGSHGCINMPPSMAYDLYDIAYIGMPVIVY